MEQTVGKLHLHAKRFQTVNSQGPILQYDQTAKNHWKFEKASTMKDTVKHKNNTKETETMQPEETFPKGTIHILTEVN